MLVSQQHPSLECHPPTSLADDAILQFTRSRQGTSRCTPSGCKVTAGHYRRAPQPRRKERPICQPPGTSRLTPMAHDDKRGSQCPTRVPACWSAAQLLHQLWAKPHTCSSLQAVVLLTVSACRVHSTYLRWNLLEPVLQRPTTHTPCATWSVGRPMLHGSAEDFVIIIYVMLLCYNIVQPLLLVDLS